MKLAQIRDYREAARRRLPRFLFDYIDGGSFGEVTLRRNRSDLEAILLDQSVMRDVSGLSLESKLFGHSWSMPVGLGPVGLAGLAARRGEVQAARAAHAARVPFSLSTFSACTCEEVASGAPGPLWFQLYVTRDRGFMHDMIDRAREAGATALIMTLDICAAGIRYSDAYSGFAGGARWSRTVRQAAQAIGRPGWAWDVGVMGRPHTLGHVASVVREGAGTDEYWSWMGESFDPSVTWKDLEEVRKAWAGPLIVKGIMNADDARTAVACGADGVVVSNHGGRQLDGASSTIAALPSIADAITGRATILMDGGIRSGVDVVRAMTQGAQAVLLGRPWVYALAARGERGVKEILDILAREMRATLALMGQADPAKLRGSSSAQITAAVVKSSVRGAAASKLSGVE